MSSEFVIPKAGKIKKKDGKMVDVKWLGSLEHKIRVGRGIMFARVKKYDDFFILDLSAPDFREEKKWNNVSVLLYRDDLKKLSDEFKAIDVKVDELLSELEGKKIESKN
jgi:hypothetical protein